MNISNARSEYHQTNPFQLKLFKKGIFWILLNEESFFIAKYFSLKITPHDKQHVKVGFPLSSQKRWLGELEKHGLGYVLIDKYQTPDGETKRKIIDQIPGKYYNTLLQINLQEYELTRQRILWLGRIWLEEKQQRNFLLKDKIEEMYLIVSQRLIKMPKIERRYFREKIERIMIDVLWDVYEYMYFPTKRRESIKRIQESIFVVREYTRFLYSMGKIKNDTVFLNAGEKWVEILKIVKTLENKEEIDKSQ